MAPAGIAILSAMGGLVAGLICGRALWAPKWFDTPEGIERKWRKVRW